MKHSLKITIVMLLFFLSSQLLGLAIVRSYIDVEKTIETGTVQWKPLLKVGKTELIARPEMQPKTGFLFILFAILIGTFIVFLIIKLKKLVLWKMWYFLAVTACLAIAFNAFMPTIIAIILAIILASLKLLRPSIIIHNATEVFIYGGLIAIFAPIFNLFWASMLLIAISIYDIYAVWRSKHMIKLAKAQTKEKIFAGLLIPYKMPSIKTIKIKHRQKAEKKKVRARAAIIGGGDIGFTLLFASTVMKEIGFIHAFITVIAATTVIALLFILGKKERYYPAMPFLTAGCFAGLLLGVSIF